MIHRKARARFCETHSQEVDGFGLQLSKAALVELRKDLEKLRWYGRVNTDGFRKVLRKMENLPFACGQLSNEKMAFSKLQFASQSQCQKDLETLNGVISLLHQKEPSIFSERFYARVAELYPSFALISLHHAIESDNASVLDGLLDKASRAGSASSFVPFLRALVQYSIRLRSRSCAEMVISRAASLPESNTIFDCLYDLIEELGQAKSTDKTPKSPQSAFDIVILLPLLSFALNRISAKHQHIILEKDSFGRTLLHYACAYGLADVCELLLMYMRDRGMLCNSTSQSAILIPDMELNTPIELAVFGNFLDVTTTLVEWHKRYCDLHDAAHARSLIQVFSETLLFAIRSNLTETVGFLLNAINLDINYAGELGETPLYIAARSGNENFVKLLLEHDPFVDACEKTNNWTSLTISCLEGYQSLTERLLEAGAAVTHRDLSDWTPLDHASYRGHIRLSKMLWERVKERSDSSAKTPKQLAKKMSVRGQRRRSISTVNSHIIVNLGSLNLYKKTPAVHLIPELFHDPSALYPESWFSLGISAIYATGPNSIIQLPVLEDATNMPLIFTTEDMSKAKLVFELYRADSKAPNGLKLIGSGIALLGSLGQGLGKTRSSLNIDYTIPILSKESLKFIGELTFTFIVSTPIVLQDTPPIVTEELWHENGPTKVVGHRGESVLSNFDVCS